MSSSLAVTYKRLAYLDLAVTAANPSTAPLPICPYHAQIEVVKSVISAAVANRFDPTVYTLIDRSWVAASSGTYRHRRIVNRRLVTPTSVMTPPDKATSPPHQPSTDSGPSLPQKKRKKVVRAKVDNRGMTRALVELAVQIILVILTVHFLHPYLVADATPIQVDQNDVRFRAVDCEHAHLEDLRF